MLADPEILWITLEDAYGKARLMSRTEGVDDVLQAGQGAGDMQPAAGGGGGDGVQVGVICTAMCETPFIYMGTYMMEVAHRKPDRVLYVPQTKAHAAAPKNCRVRSRLRFRVRRPLQGILPAASS